MPDLSILIEMAEFYHVEVKELIDGERKGERMDKELKETLTKVADYNKAEKEKAVKVGNTAFAIMYAICAVMIVIQLAVTANLAATLTKVADYNKAEKEKAVKVGNTAFAIMYAICAVMIVIQLAVTANLAAVAGETAVLLIGGAVYLGITVYNGLWGRASSFKDSPFGDALISAICAGIFTIFLSAAYLRMGALGITVYNGLWGRASSFKDSPFGDALISAICAGIFTIFLSAAYLRMGADMSQTVRVGLIFFVAIAIVGNIVLRTLSCFSRKRKESLSDSGEDEETRDCNRWQYRIKNAVMFQSQKKRIAVR